MTAHEWLEIPAAKVTKHEMEDSGPSLSSRLRCTLCGATKAEEPVWTREPGARRTSFGLQPGTPAKELMKLTPGGWEPGEHPETCEDWQADWVHRS